jgi:RNA polymerase sigma factor (sigma-70 family)
MAAKKNHGVSTPTAHSLRPVPELRANDLKLADRCAGGDEEAVKTLVSRLEKKLRGILVRRGANDTLTEDLLADLWSDCFAPRGRSGLLLKYSGKCSLDTWLATVLIHRWLDGVRRDSRIQPLPSDRSRDGHLVYSEPQRDPDTEELLREALQFAFDHCDPEALVMLQLVYLHGISQRQLAVVWRVSESKISRVLSRATRRIRDNTLTQIHRRDPLLAFGWDDVVDLCSRVDFSGTRLALNLQSARQREINGPAECLFVLKISEAKSTGLVPSP